MDKGDSDSLGSAAGRGSFSLSVSVWRGCLLLVFGSLRVACWFARGGQFDDLRYIWRSDGLIIGFTFCILPACSILIRQVPSSFEVPSTAEGGTVILQYRQQSTSKNEVPSTARRIEPSFFNTAEKVPAYWAIPCTAESGTVTKRNTVNREKRFRHSALLSRL